MGDLHGEAVFALDPSIQLVESAGGPSFDAAELREIRRFIATREEEIRAAWPRYYAYVESFRAKWVALLGQKR